MWCNQTAYETETFIKRNYVRLCLDDGVRVHRRMLDFRLTDHFCVLALSSWWWQEITRKGSSREKDLLVRKSACNAERNSKWHLTELKMHETVSLWLELSALVAS